MTIVAQVIKNKAVQSIFTISPNATVLEAIKIMADKGVGALVVAEDEKVIGIFSERDYTRKIALMER
ncbi:MAG: CBS domain-containing protein, partial [Acinetobacter sp.]|nr:CBS domain-containing protein [Acinetobacter sp.]